MSEPRPPSQPTAHGIQPHAGQPVQPSPGSHGLPRQAGMQPQTHGVQPHAPGVHPHSPGMQPRPAVTPHAPSPGLRPAGAPMQPAQRLAPAQGIPRQPAGSTINPMAVPRKAQDDEAIELVEDADEAPVAPDPGSAASKIKFGAEVGIRKHDWKRQHQSGGTGACRVRTFHAKLSDQGLEYVDEAINVWLDDHPDVDIKFVTTNVGMFDGKFKDLALIVNVWY